MARSLHGPRRWTWRSPCYTTLRQRTVFLSVSAWVLVFTSMPRNSSSWVRDILVLMINPKHWRMWVTTSKYCAANTADLWSIDLQGLEHSDPIIASRKGALVRSFCCSVYYLLKERLLALDIFLVKVSLRDSCDRGYQSGEVPKHP